MSSGESARVRFRGALMIAGFIQNRLLFTALCFDTD